MNKRFRCSCLRVVLALASRFNKTLVIPDLFSSKKLYEKKQHEQVKVSHGLYD